MRKKLISLLLAIFILSSLSTVAFAYQPLMTEDLKLFVDVYSDSPQFEPCTLRFNLFTKNGTWLSNQAVDVSKRGMIEIVFPIGKYEVGTEFKLVATTGLETYDYYGSIFGLNEECTIGTYAYRKENGELVICNEGYIITTPLTASKKYVAEKHVNDNAIWSNTPYLIWVSKANYTVNVFFRENGRWNLINELPCSIGAPSTPTITGQYTYHQYQPKWQYNGYYVGPIMRFYRGYALHSTLIYNDGTDKDPRIGEQISLGCVRLRPDDIQWLVDTIPLDTKVYITNQ